MATTVLGLKTFTASDPVDYNEINDNYNKIDNGVKTAFQGRAAHNLLDNSWFVNPVNQRGQATYNTSGYCIDRWLLAAGSASIGDSGITLTGATFVQRVALKAGTYTFALHLSDGTTLFINIQYDGKSSITQIGGTSGTTGAYINSYNYSQGVVTFQFVQGAGVVHIASWAALYEGSYTADTLPAYQPKGYSAELAECQRYYIIGRRYRPSVATFVDSTQYLMIFDVQLPQRMIIKPTATIKKFPSYIRINGQQYSFTDLVISATYYNKDENTIGIVLKCTSNFGSFMTGHFDEIAIEFSSEM